MEYRWSGLGPIGELVATFEDEFLVALHISQKLKSVSGISSDNHSELPPHKSKRASLVFDQLAEYFAGVRREFDVSIQLQNGTEFARRVLLTTRSIPLGAVTSYGELATQIGRPGASRAVGQVLHHNPIPIIIPCHRVVGKDGSLVGFGSGIRVKEWLLSHEGVHFDSRGRAVRG